jgi:hypothetical protein
LSALLSDIDHRSEEQTDRELARELEELRAATANEQVLRAQLDDVIARAGELGTELAQASPGQRLYQFVSERADSDDYRGKLGLISTIRKDFEKLIELMEKWRKTGDDIRTPIPRIILYIDDLDRCSPRQVVEVLQAVHLLLALELFVVVVGVDPRWLLRSLGREFRSTLTEGPDPDPDWSLSTPQDYLEKIFNIPFILPAMNPANFGSLLRGLAEDASDDETQETDDRHDEPAETQRPDDQAAPSAGAGGEGPTDGANRARPETDASGPIANPRPTAGTSHRDTVDRGAPLTSQEIELLSSLAPLVRTPRSAKRLLNLYRLLRSTPEPRLAASFLGADGRPGESQAVAVLVGLLTGYPQLLGDLLFAPADSKAGRAGGLLHRTSTNDTKETWQEFVQGLDPVENGQGWSNAVAEHLDETEAAEWRRLVANLAPSSKLVKLDSLEAFQRWAPLVARFSFRLAPVVLDRRAPRPSSETSPNGAAQTPTPDPVGA